MTFETPVENLEVGKKIYFTSKSLKPQLGTILSIKSIPDGRALLSVAYDGGIVDLTRKIG